MTWSIRKTAVLVAFGLTAMTVQAEAQTYPTKTIKWVVPTPPGSATDILGRIMAQKLSDALGQPVVVENQGAASGTLAAEQVAKAPADGYTLMMGTNSSHAVNQALFPDMKVDVIKDFTPIRLLATNTLLLTVHPSMPFKTYGEFIAYAKANPGKLSYGSPANGTSPHIAMEWLKQLTGIDIVHVPYRGAPAALNAIIANEVQVQLINVPNAMPTVREGKVRVLAQAGPARVEDVPDAPTFAELGLKEFIIEAWMGVFMPAGVPRDVVTRVSGEIGKALMSPDVAKRFRDLGLDPADISLDKFGDRQRADVALWAKMVKETGAKID